MTVKRPKLCYHIDLSADDITTPDVYSLRVDCKKCDKFVAWLDNVWEGREFDIDEGEADPNWQSFA